MKAWKALALLNHKTRICGGLHVKTYTILFDQTNAFIWGHKVSQKILII